MIYKLICVGVLLLSISCMNVFHAGAASCASSKPVPLKNSGYLNGQDIVFQVLHLDRGACIVVVDTIYQPPQEQASHV